MPSSHVTGLHPHVEWSCGIKSASICFVAHCATLAFSVFSVRNCAYLLDLSTVTKSHPSTNKMVRARRDGDGGHADSAGVRRLEAAR